MISQKLHENLVFYVYSVKIPFSKNMILPFFQKGTVDLFWKKKIKDGISGIIEKVDIHRRKYCISSDRKIKDNKKVYFYKKVPMILCIFMEPFPSAFMYCFPMKKIRKLNT